MLAPWGQDPVHALHALPSYNLIVHASNISDSYDHYIADLCESKIVAQQQTSVLTLEINNKQAATA
jgi:hypothetical protein